MDCTHPYSRHEDEDGCASSARAAPGSLPFIVKYVYFSTAGIDALAVFCILLRDNAYRGRWLDYRRRLRSIASTLMTLISLLKRFLSSSRLRVAQMSLRPCSGPAGRVFPAAYRATSFISTTTSTSSKTACERSLFNTCRSHEAESFPAAQKFRDCLWALGVSSRFGVPGLFSAVFLFLLWVELSLTTFQTVTSRCRERHEPAACALPQADQKTGKLHSTLLVDRSEATFF